jgi:hypothetical protein
VIGIAGWVGLAPQSYRVQSTCIYNDFSLSFFLLFSKNINSRRSFSLSTFPSHLDALPCLYDVVNHLIPLNALSKTTPHK